LNRSGICEILTFLGIKEARKTIFARERKGV